MGERSNRATGGVRSLAREPLRMTRTLASLAAGFAGDVTALLKVCSHHAVKMATQFFFRFIVYKEEHMFSSVAAASLKSEASALSDLACLSFGV